MEVRWSGNTGNTRRKCNLTMPAADSIRSEAYTLAISRPLRLDLVRLHGTGAAAKDTLEEAILECI